MPSLRPEVDPEGLLEYSVVFTDRALNHMSRRFQSVMRGLSSELKEVYNGAGVAIVPGGGTYAMEAVARQLAGDGPTLIVRNGWFSFRWSQIFEALDSPRPHVLCAAPVREGPEAPYAPPPVEEVVAAIHSARPTAVFAAHVETSAGMILPDAWLEAVGAAAAEVGALFVLDCVASGAVWVDMRACAVDVLISAPQKGWSAPASAGVVVLSERAEARLLQAPLSSFSLDLKRWRGIMKAYEEGGHAYHATMPTDALAVFYDALLETRAMGLEDAQRAQWRLGHGIRAALARRGVPSVAAPGFEAPGVVVSYLPVGAEKLVPGFAAAGVQVAGGVPLRCGEPDSFATFRVGLFGLDKLRDVESAIARFEQALDAAL